MRKIKTREEIEKKEIRNKIIVGVILVALMVLSTMGYAFFSGEPEEKREKIQYNGIEFIQADNGMWVFELQGVQFATQHTPKETENISAVIFRTPANYGGKTLFFLGEGPARREIEINMVGKLVPRSQNGCIEDYEDMCNNNTPMKDCSDDNVIIIEESNNTKISQDENCIFIESPYWDQARAGDAFIFQVLGIQ